MKNIIFASLSLFVATSVLWAGPSVDPLSVSMVQPTGVGPAEISYVLSEAPAVITVDIQTNAGNGAWASIGDGNVRTLSGDVNRLVQPSASARKIVWKAHRDWPDHLVAGPNTRAVIEVWPTNAPPEMMVLDLEQGDVAFYRSEAAMPFAVTDDLCVSKKLVMRKVKAANVRWRMGTDSKIIPKNGAGKAGDVVTGYNETLHYVAFSEDYYLAIYPITQKQYGILKAKNSSLPAQGYGVAGDALPQGRLSYNQCRGASPAINWPLTGHQVADGSVMGILRAYFGYGIELDLPTEAQWEFACRAGTTGNWYYGDTYSAEHCWSGGKTSPCDVRYSRNPWGFYGFYGNCGNHCLEYANKSYVVQEPEIINPAGSAYAEAGVGVNRMTRGGYYSLDELGGTNPADVFCRSGARYRYTASGASDVWSVRLAAPAAIGGGE